jgi:hypothetical protein
MAADVSPDALAGQARRLYTDELVRGLDHVVRATQDQARGLLDRPSDHATAMRRRDLLQALNKGAPAWHGAMVTGLRRVLAQGMVATRSNDLPPPGSRLALTLVSDDSIELEIVTSRLALAVMDRASWEFADVRARVAHLEGRSELEPHDMLRAHVLARVVVDAWRGSGLTLEGWRELQGALHDELAALVEEAYHETNRWLVAQRVLPQVDLRPYIRRTRAGPDRLGDRPGHPADAVAPVDRVQRPQGEEPARVVLERLNQRLAMHVNARSSGPHSEPLTSAAALSPGLARAIETAEHGMRQGTPPGTEHGDASVAVPALLEALDQRRQALKKAAATPQERATIEIVALLFQSILTEDRIPPAIRVWFARLQMPVLRVAVTEPEFFATIEHPARRLIDRMGACVMGFDLATGANPALEREIKRIVQVVEAYPDTGRRVFQTVLIEFEEFLEQYFREENELSRQGVSLAQQVEHRETLAIQYTIELRRMLDDVPVQDGVRQFLFQVWADVLATSAMRHGTLAEQTMALKRAAADLIWSASAKVTRAERAEVIRRLPLLLKTLREGMGAAGIDQTGQDGHVRQLNNALAAAFTAKAAAIPDERLRVLMERLATLEELLPDVADLEIDENMVLDLSVYQGHGLEVVLEGGSMPTPAMLAWARELQVGSWYLLHRDGSHSEALQLSWQGLRGQLSLFVTPTGRCVLFQQHRLAGFLQAGLLVPAQDEALTVRATRSALAKIDQDSSRLTA